MLLEAANIELIEVHNNKSARKLRLAKDCGRVSPVAVYVTPFMHSFIYHHGQ